jgi:iron(II)-dependent oxidoreductase
MDEAVLESSMSKERIAGALSAARERTLRLLEPVSDEDLVRQFSPLMSPLVWDLAHIGHFEELWLLRRLGGAAPIFPSGDDVYDTFEHPREERPSLELLDPETSRAYLDDVRKRVLDVLAGIELDASDPLLRDGLVFGLVAQHVLRVGVQGAPRRLVGDGSIGRRRTFRNWDFPVRRDLFAGIRCARDAE